MFVVKLDSFDNSCHTVQVDADFRRQQLINSGIDETRIQIVQQDAYNPPQTSL